MVWLILAFVVLLLLSVILFTRMRITIDSYGHIARASWGWVLHLCVTESNDFPVLRLNAFGWQRQWGILDLIVTRGDSVQSHESDKKSRAKTRKKRRPKLALKRIVRIIKSCRIHAFKLEFDTDDYVLNAWLFPMVEILRYRGADISVNFNGINGIKLDISNSPARMLVAWLK